ncbi:hypothetical protein [Salinibacillus xinjiangensis]|uniref:SPOR domain-containing protein n=1 Tax=Salinibacillus xinjiangensis TaxID=1229268 RepID=A0A6G1XB99_9BACI|nr:hypothetical protein [Salinibacillus xinjiangensis]MRG88217.1 hypothetical protein [Salinibacillus xinjiangensis]
MDKNQKKLSVRINGEEKEVTAKSFYKDEDAKKEMAAALDQNREPRHSNQNNPFSYTSNQDEPPKVEVLQRPYQKKRSLFSNMPSLKRLVTAGVSAIIVGSILGFVLLNLLSGIDEPQQALGIEDETNQSATGTDGEDAVTTSPANENTVAVSFDGVDSHVVQVGVYSSEGKAQERQNLFKDSGVYPFIWESEGMFYLFASLGLTNETAKQLETSIEELGFDPEKDAFVKSWAVAASEKDISEAEGNWIKEGMSLWKETVPLATSYSEELSSQIDKTRSWYQNKPESISESGEQFAAKYNQLLEQSEESHWLVQNQLIGILHAYQQYMNS